MTRRSYDVSEAAAHAAEVRARVPAGASVARDVREIITNYERYRKGTLEFFCEIFGVPSPKSDITGKNVGEYFKAGKLDEIAKYCLGDCKATGQLYLKLRNYYR